MLADASVRNFQQGRAGYVADTVEQALLLLEDMADLKSMRKHEVFLSLKRDLALVSFLIALFFFFFFFFFFFLVFFIIPILVFSNPCTYINK